MRKISNQYRSYLERYLTRMQTHLSDLRHVSGDECNHCSVRAEIKEVSEVLKTGIMPEDDSSDGLIEHWEGE